MSMDPGAQPGFLITMGRMYEDVGAIRGEIQEFRGEVQNLSGEVRRALETNRDHEDRLRHQEQTAATKQDVETLERDLAPRVRSLEKSRWTAAGAAAVLSGGGAALLSQLFGKH